MAQTARRLTDAVNGFLVGHRVRICDRDSKWTDGFRQILQSAGVRIVLTPIRAPNANAYAERFVRSIREECLHRLILFGERRLFRPRRVRRSLPWRAEPSRARQRVDHPGSRRRWRDSGTLGTG
jgi:transposase InsO family protein